MANRAFELRPMTGALKQYAPPSLAFRDNRCTIHRGIAEFYKERRIMHRVAITDTERPH